MLAPINLNFQVDAFQRDFGLGPPEPLNFAQGLHYAELKNRNSGRHYGRGSLLSLCQLLGGTAFRAPYLSYLCLIARASLRDDHEMR